MFSWEQSEIDAVQCPVDRWGGSEVANKSVNFGLAWCPKDWNLTI
jgi:hypothetical protein